MDIIAQQLDSYSTPVAIAPVGDDIDVDSSGVQILLYLIPPFVVLFLVYHIRDAKALVQDKSTYIRANEHLGVLVRLFSLEMIAAIMPLGIETPFPLLLCTSLVCLICKVLSSERR